MIRTQSVLLTIVWSLGLCVPVFAQHGPGRHAPGAEEKAQAPTYDPNAEVTITGTVEDVKTGRSALSRIFQFHTMGLKHGGTHERQLLVKTDTTTLQVHLGPTAFLDEQKMEIEKGDVLNVTGSHVAAGASKIVLAREIRKGNSVWMLRDVTGQPLWNSVQAERRGFWTKGKVLFVGVVAAKVAAIVLLGAHD